MTLKEIKENRYPVEDFGGVQIDWLIDRVEEVEEILRDIITTDHCIYNGNDQYGIGVVDGHRCAANMSRKAWEDKS